MDNSMLNQTQGEPMAPQGMNGMNMMPQQPEKKGGKGIFVAILIIVIAILLGYWYLNAPQKVPETQQQQVQNNAAPTNQEQSSVSANVSAAEDGLESMYFEGTSNGL